MLTPVTAPDGTVLHLLTAALEVLDRKGDAVAAAYVSMALARVEEHADPAPVA